MKKIALLIAIVFLTVACGDPIKKDGKVYECYGIIDKDEVKSPDVQYDLVVGNIVWSVIAFETAIVPIWLIGWRTHCPIK